MLSFPTDTVFYFPVFNFHVSLSSVFDTLHYSKEDSSRYPHRIWFILLSLKLLHLFSFRKLCQKSEFSSSSLLRKSCIIWVCPMLEKKNNSLTNRELCFRESKLLKHLVFQILFLTTHLKMYFWKLPPDNDQNTLNLF